jgi:tRNA U38,U39,U40 pseudouridine synthase TruA
MRRYGYHFSGETSMKGLREAAGLFRGEHDFASFTVERVGGRLRIDRIRVRREGPFVLADFEAERFARGLVRRIAGAMESYAGGETTEAQLREALRGGPIRVAPAAPEGLFLLDVDCGIKWPPTPEHVAETMSKRARATALARRFAEQLGAETRGGITVPRNRGRRTTLLD